MSTSSYTDAPRAHHAARGLIKVMKYLWYAFLGLFSLGFLGLIAGIFGFAWVVNHYGQDLPDYSQLKEYKPPIITRIYAGDGRLMAEFAQERRVFVPIEEIPRG
jgi:penicillin-binding protein 1A